MKRSWILPIPLLCLGWQASAADVPGVKLERIVALAKTYFRDSAEVPMDVAVTTVVTDKAGKPKRNAQSTVQMNFHGYNLQADKFTVHGNSGWFNTRALHDSVSGDLAAFMAPLGLMPHDGKDPNLEIRQPAQPGQPVLVTSRSTGCPAFAIRTDKHLFPARYCGDEQFTLTVKPTSELAFQHYTFDSQGLPAAANVRYLGDVKILAFHTDVDFQEGSLPNDPKPFLWPKQAIVLVTTDKGKISITSRYSPKAGAKH